MTARHVAEIVVAGLVQGVGYRAWLQRAAEARGLEGWVRNRLNGSVQAVLAGPRAQVESVAAAARRGPQGARVDAVEIYEATEAALAARPDGASGVAILPTA